MTKRKRIKELTAERSRLLDRLAAAETKCKALSDENRRLKTAAGRSADALKDIEKLRELLNRTIIVAECLGDKARELEAGLEQPCAKLAKAKTESETPY